MIYSIAIVAVAVAMVAIASRFSLVRVSGELDGPSRT